MKGLLVLATLTLVYTCPALASEQPDVIELNIKQPQIVDPQQLEEYQRQRDEQIREFNTDISETLNRTYADKVRWEGVLGEFRDRQINIERERNARPPNLPTGF